MNKAYVVGYGLIDALGNNPTDCFANMLNDIDYTKDVPSLTDEQYKIHRAFQVDKSTINLLPNLPKALTNLQLMAFHSTDQALKMAGLEHSKNVAVIFSTILNDLETMDELFPRISTNKRVTPRMVLNRIPDMLSSYIAQYYQFMGTTTAIFAACATGINTIDYAMRLLDEYDYVVVGSGDAATFPFVMKAFHAMGAIGNVSCPFDINREGFVMGDGAGTLILQSEQMVKKYNSKVHATLYPPGISNDAYDATSPAEDGRGAILAVDKALQLVTGPIHAVNAHATSTPAGDDVEYNVVTNRFGAIPIYAPKAKIGHTMAGSGIVETIYAIESMNAGMLPHIHNLKETNIDSLNCLVRTNTPLPTVDTLRTLNNSFGFGGKCASQVIEVTQNN
jgi:3-oxoacyl-[acyl-carrier-protein] synthase II